MSSAMADLDRIADHCFSAAVPLGQAKRKGGVYFLMRHGRIAYVGHSGNVKRRVYQHRRNLVEFDGVLVNDRGNAVREMLCIRRFQPQFNAKGFWRWMNNPVPKAFDARHAK